MKLKYFIPAFMAVIAMLVGCSTDNDPIYLGEINVSTSYVAIDKEGGSTPVTVKAVGDWAFDTASIPEWLTVSPLSGSAGESTITFSAGAGAGRTAALKVRCAGVTQEINVIQGLAEVSNATVAEVMAGPDAKTYRVKGVVTSIANLVYGNWYMNDGTSDTDLYIYGTLDKNGKDGQNNSIAAWGIEVGDEITIEGPKTTYNGTVELVNVSVVSISKSLIKCDSLTIAGEKVTDAVLPIEGGDVVAHLTCKATGVAIEIPEAAKDWLYVTSTTAGDNPTVTFRALENKGADRSVNVTFKTTDGSKTYSAGAVISQKGVAKGKGTDTDPYNVAAALNYTRALGADVKSDKDIYVKGIISSVKYEYSAQYGTATYNISDDGTENGVFTVYSSLYYDNQAWEEGNDQIKVGDEVVVVGKVIYYKGTTPEFASKENWLYSLNGKTSCVTASVAEFIDAAEDATNYSLTGVLTKLYYYKENVAGFYIKDFSGETLVYKSDGFTGTEAKVGDIVNVIGKRGSYKGTVQMTNSKFKLEHAVTPVTIAEFLSKPDDKTVYYMVTGTINSLLGSNGKENDYGNLYLTDGTNELYVYGCYPGWGATGDDRKFFIKDNNIKVGDELTMIGYKDTYKGLVELCGGCNYAFKHAE